jgi:hypothetical protein
MASNSKNIAELLNGDVTVTAVDIADDAVTAAKIADDAVTTDKLATQTGNVDFADNSKIRLGTGNDLQIYHDGSNNHTYIEETGSGSLRIRGENLLLEDSSGKDYLNAVADAQVELSHNGVKKFETTSSGIAVTGTLDATDITVGAVSETQSLIQMIANPTSGANTIHFGDAASGAAAFDGYIQFAHDSRTMQFGVGSAESMRILRDDGTGDGAVKIKGALGLNFSNPYDPSQYMVAVGTDNSYRSGVVFELQSNQSLWDCGFVKIKCAAGRNGLESRSAAEYLYKFQMHNESISGIGLVSSSGNTGDFTISVTEANANSSTGTVELKVKSTAATNHGSSVTYVEVGHFNGISRVRRGI